MIDDFTVTSAYSARTNRTEPQVVVGKRLSDRVRATATTGLTTDSNFKTGVEWRLNDQTQRRGRLRQRADHHLLAVRQRGRGSALAARVRLRYTGTGG